MPTTELEALVGHLFVVGGRSISAASPGAIAKPPPRKAARGRDSDTFFGLIGLGAGQRESASLYEESVRGVAETYFNTPGSVTSVLRESIAALNKSLLKTNASRETALSVGLACAILREQELYIAVVGPARCFLIREDFVERLPSDEELEEGTPALGLDSDPDVRFYRREVRSGDFIILSDASLNQLKNLTIRHAVETGEVDAAILNLRSVAPEYAAAEVIKLVDPLAEGEADPVPPRRLPMAPPLQETGGAARSAAPGLAPHLEADATALAEPPAADAALEDKPGVSEKAAPAFRQIGRDAATTLARAAGGTRTLAERMLPEGETDNPLAQRFQLSTTMQVGVAIAVAVIVALLTTAVYRFRGATSQYAQLVREAQEEIDLARAAGNNQGEARPHWSDAIFLLDQAADIRSPSAEIWALRGEALAALDSYDHVTRVSPVMLREYEPGSVLRGPIVQGINVYLIDTTSDMLYREDLNETGSQLVNGEPQIVTRRGDVINNQVVGGLIDLAWMTEGGVPQRNVLAVLSRDQGGNGLLITYSPSWDVSLQVLPSSQAWVDPRAIAIYDRALYILDSGANEIWRYPAGTDSYNNAPQRYFTDFVPELTDAIDLEIDTNGNIYVLHSSGRITKYFFGRAETFTYDGLPQPVSAPTALFLNLSPFDRAFFIADRGHLYTTAVSGAFLANYKDADDEIFDALSGVYNVDQPSHVYITAGNRLYYFPRP